MKNTNIQDRIEMAQEIAEVRRTGLVNMFDRAGVIEILEFLAFDYTAEYLTENLDDYMELLKMSGKY